MSIQEIRTFKNVQDAIMIRGKIEDNTTRRNDIKEKINTVYQNVSFKKAYRWSGKTRTLKLRKKEETGTITATNGSHVLTGSGTAFDELTHRFSKIKIGSQPTPYKIVRVASTTSLTMEAPFVGDTASSLGYTIYKDEYGLWPDLMNVRKFMLPGFAFRENVLPSSPEELDRLRNRTPFRTGIPKKYTLNGLGVYAEKTWADFLMDTDFWEDDQDNRPERNNLIVWPALLTEDRLALVRYTRIVPVLELDSELPLIPYENRKVLVSGGLKEWFLQQRDIVMFREWERKYKQDLKEMESDVESTDDELIFELDRNRNRRHSQAIWNDDEILVS